MWISSFFIIQLLFKCRSLIKGITPNVCVLCFVLIHSILLNILCVLMYTADTKPLTQCSHTHTCMHAQHSDSNILSHWCFVSRSSGPHVLLACTDVTLWYGKSLLPALCLRLPTSSWSPPCCCWCCCWCWEWIAPCPDWPKLYGKTLSNKTSRCSSMCVWSVGTRETRAVQNKWWQKGSWQ